MDFRKQEKTRKSYLAHENDSYDASLKLKQFTKKSYPKVDTNYKSVS